MPLPIGHKDWRNLRYNKDFILFDNLWWFPCYVKNKMLCCRKNMIDEGGLGNMGKFVGTPRPWAAET